MMRIVWIVFAILGLAWTGLAVLLHDVAGSGAAAVVTISRWLQMEPSSTQWLADILHTAGGAVQLVVWLIWAVGIAGLVTIGRTIRRVQTEALNMADELERAQAMRRGPTIDGEVQARHMGPAHGPGDGAPLRRPPL